MSLTESITTLFGSSNILAICLWIAGIILFSIEFFQPMRGISYSIGGAVIITAFVLNAIHGSPGESFVFVFTSVLILFGLHIVALSTQKRDWLRVSRLERTGTVKSRKFGSLVGSIGIANSPIVFTGSVTVDDVNLVVYSEVPISAGERVRITKVSHDKITVVPEIDSEMK